MVQQTQELPYISLRGGLGQFSGVFFWGVTEISTPAPQNFFDVPMLLRNDVAAFFVISIAIVDSGVPFYT